MTIRSLNSDRKSTTCRQGSNSDTEYPKTNRQRKSAKDLTCTIEIANDFHNLPPTNILIRKRVLRTKRLYSNESPNQCSREEKLYVYFLAFYILAMFAIYFSAFYVGNLTSRKCQFSYSNRKYLAMEYALHRQMERFNNEGNI